MMQLRRLSEVTLQLSAKQKQSNGATITTYSSQNKYNVIIQEITDEMYATIYGANITNMLRISSVQQNLERFLKSKSNDTPDNITKYFILIGEKRYKVRAVSANWVDIEFYETNRALSPLPSA